VYPERGRAFFSISDDFRADVLFLTLCDLFD